MTDTAMTNEQLAPYDAFCPGDLIAAERVNGVQVAIKKDIRDQVGKVQKNLDEFKATPVDASKFGGKTPSEWTTEYDKRYVQRSELKNGWGEYRRYLKQIDRPETTPDPALIEHGLRRYPTVTVFELAKLLTDVQPADATKFLSEDTTLDAKFLIYYAGRRDPIAEKLMTRGSDTVFWGDKLELILEQFEMTPSPTQYFDDVLNDLWGKMFDPGLDQDNFRRDAYGHSKYIQSELLKNGRTVQELKSGGIWDDLRMAIRPQLISTNSEFADPTTKDPNQKNTVQVFHLSQNTIEIRAAKPIDLMVLLRT